MNFVASPVSSGRRVARRLPLPVPPTQMPRLKSFTPIECPMCKRRTNTHAGGLN